LTLLALSAILNHPTFLPKFLRLNRKLLADHHNTCARTLQRYGIPFLPSNAGFFIWADLSAFLANEPGDSWVEKERSLNDRLFNGGVHLATSEAFSGEDSGWFRISFSVTKDLLELGLKR
jgi:DNA-binding transcriptional MocR family regulator